MNAVIISEEAHQQILTDLKTIKAQLDTKQKESPFTDPWLDLVEVCKLLHVSKRTMQSYRDKGEIEFSQIGAKIFFRASAIDKFLLRHQQKAFAK